MKSRLSQIAVVLVCVALFAGLTQAQTVSGIPGDGIPDIYYFPIDATVNTSVGFVSRPVGTLLVDTDGTDMIALLVGGANPSSTTPDDGNYLTGNTARLPDPNAAPPLFSSDWTGGFIGGAFQWIRINPLATDGFVGVIGEYDDQFGIFPDTGIANYGAGATFDAVFDDGVSEALWEVLYATQESGVFYTNVCILYCIPEPTSLNLLGMAFLGTLMGRRR